MSGKVQRAGIARRYNREAFTARIDGNFVTAIPLTDSKSVTYTAADADSGQDISSFFKLFMIQVKANANASANVCGTLKAQFKLANADSWMDMPSKLMDVPSGHASDNTITSVEYTGDIAFMAIKVPGPGARVRLHHTSGHDDGDITIYVSMSDSTVHHDISR